jgi:hypothetical protein
MVLMLVAVSAGADPCLVVYPASPCEYHYDPAEYYTVGLGDSLYAAAFDRGGEVLIDILTGEIAYDVYQAPNITHFVMDTENQGYFTVEMDFELVVDGFSNEPVTYYNVLLVFDTVVPSWCEPDVWVDASPVMYDEMLGWYYPIGDLTVSTPTPWGNNFSDVMNFDFSWANCVALRIYAFADENYNMVRDGGECFSAYSHDTTVPVKESTWGAIKELYGE